MLNCLMDEVRVDTINDKHRPTLRGDIALHINHVVLDVAHELFRIKIPLLVVVAPSLAQISASQWAGIAVLTQYHPGHWRGYSLGEHEHGRA